MNRAWAVLEIKEIGENPDGEMTISGMASTPTTDRMDDVVDPMGAKFALPMPLLWQHNADMPIGLVTLAKPNKTGIPFSATVARAGVTAFIDNARALLKAGLVRGVSIGFRALESEPIKNTYGLLFKQWEWLELSAVTIPANAEATITTIKSIDLATAPAASGDKAQPVSVVLPKRPGVTGSSKGNKVKTIKEQIEAFDAKRAALVARNEELMQKSGEDGRTLDGAEADEYDGIAAELKTIDAHLTRLRDHEKATIAKAQVIEPAADGTVTRRESQPHVTWGESRLPKGVAFARYAQCVGASKGNLMVAEQLARKHFRDMPYLGDVFKIATTGNLGEAMMHAKAAVAAGTTSDATWAAPLVQQTEAAAEFVEFLRPMTLLGRIPGIRRVPFNIKFPRQTAGTNGTFVGEGLPKPLGKLDFELLTLTWAKAATIVVMTDELMRFSNPSAEMLVRDDLAAGISQYLDKRFIDPVYAGVANVSPASITNGVTPIASLGVTVALIEDTAKLALEALATGNFTGQYVWIMSPAVAISLSLKRAATVEMRAFPDITAQGGTFLGYPVVTSNNVALSGSPTESFVVLVEASQIMLADDGGVTIDMSNEASLVMDGAPSNPATSTVSLWQSNLVGLRAERYINWRMRHTGAVQVITMNVLW